MIICEGFFFKINCVCNVCTGGSPCNGASALERVEEPAPAEMSIGSSYSMTGHMEEAAPGTGASGAGEWKRCVL